MLILDTEYCDWSLNSFLLDDALLRRISLLASGCFPENYLSNLRPFLNQLQYSEAYSKVLDMVFRLF